MAWEFADYQDGHFTSADFNRCGKGMASHADALSKVAFFNTGGAGGASYKYHRDLSAPAALQIWLPFNPKEPKLVLRKIITLKFDVVSTNDIEVNVICPDVDMEPMNFKLNKNANVNKLKHAILHHCEGLGLCSSSANIVIKGATSGGQLARNVMTARVERIIHEYRIQRSGLRRCLA